MMATAQVYQFKLVLVEVEPLIWRRIQVPETYSFWDLHVALQDAMGWLDYHLHVFRVARPGAGEVEQIGIPDDDPFEGDKPTLPGWEIPITRHFLRPGTTVQYEYDFGDGWEHELTLEAILPRQAGQKYPLCVDGARACPPEDCPATRISWPGSRTPLTRSTRAPSRGSVVDSTQTSSIRSA